MAGRSVAGPGRANQDRYSTYLDPADGSWVVAVAADLPGRVDSTDAMWKALIAERLLEAADGTGLDDDATVTVAHTP